MVLSIVFNEPGKTDKIPEAPSVVYPAIRSLFLISIMRPNDCRLLIRQLTTDTTDYLYGMRNDNLLYNI